MRSQAGVGNAHGTGNILAFSRPLQVLDLSFGFVDDQIAIVVHQRHALDHVRGILYAAIDAFLAALADAMHIVVLEPVDVCCEQGLLDLLELRLADDGFNLFHTLLFLGWFVSIRV